MRNLWWIVVYYLALMAILLSWGNASEAPPLFFRVLFFVAVVAPSFFSKVPLLLVASVFLTITLYGNTYSYMPTSLSLYVVVAIVYYLYIVISSKNIKSYLPQNNLLLLLLLSFIVNLLSGGGIKNITWSLLLIVLLKPLLDSNDKVTAHLFTVSFIVVSLVLSGLFLVVGDQYTQIYDVEEGLERSGWVDPNYFCSIIGMGAVVALCEIMSSKKPLVIILFLLAVLLISVFTMVSIASRGALLALSVSVIILLFTSKIKPFPKIILLGLIALFIYWMYTSSTFDLLLYRIENDDNGGSGRTKIWSAKLGEFMSHGSFTELLFGVGFDNAMELGSSVTKKGVHNDYLAFFIEYGLCGVVLFLYTLLSPFFKVKERNNRPIVLGLTAYIAICVVTLEPMTLGILFFYVFYSYIDYLSLSSIKR